MKTKVFTQVGTTPDGKPCIAGIVNAYTTYGVPLFLTLEKIYAKDLVPSWSYFVKEAQANGWSDSKIIREANEGLRDAGYPGLAAIVIPRIRAHIAAAGKSSGLLN